MSQNKPVHEIRFGCIVGSIWKNETEKGVRHNVTFSRLYFKDDTWNSTTSFGRDDLHLVAKIADVAETWIFQNSN
ncbi:MAG: hypothetical protein KDB27_21150 [Planctomycetales bacterium]|nr:hypothetical protein [Planctomycetales bacterium]